MSENKVSYVLCLIVKTSEWVTKSTITYHVGMNDHGPGCIWLYTFMFSTRLGTMVEFSILKCIQSNNHVSGYKSVLSPSASTDGIYMTGYDV